MVKKIKFRTAKQRHASAVRLAKRNIKRRSKSRR